MLEEYEYMSSIFSNEHGTVQSSVPKEVIQKTVQVLRRKLEAVIEAAMKGSNLKYFCQRGHVLFYHGVAVSSPAEILNIKIDIKDKDEGDLYLVLKLNYDTNVESLKRIVEFCKTGNLKKRDLEETIKKEKISFDFMEAKGLLIL